MNNGSKQTQKEAVFVAVTQVLRERGVHPKEGQKISELMTREYRAIVNAILFNGFKSGKIDMNTPEILQDDGDLKTYISGLQSNWLRKDKRLNGGTKYKPKAEGSRSVSNDEAIKSMRQLLSQTSDPSDRAEIQRFIDARLAQIAASKAPKIDTTHLPAPLHRLVARN
jgi:hypothetical protein